MVDGNGKLQLRQPIVDASPRRILIDGKWRDAASGTLIDCVNPADGNVLASVQGGDSHDIDLAVTAARKAFESDWSKAKPFDRQALLLRFADLVEYHFDELAWLDVLEMGVPITLALARKRRIIAMIRYYAGLATALHGHTIGNSMAAGDFESFTRKEPVGVVGAIIPWNVPLVAAIWKIAPALATGCTLVQKPSEDASLTALRLAELLLEAGVPDGVFNLVTGYGETAGAALASHPGVDKLSFTGSASVGRRIVAASSGNFKRLSLELGGKSPNIVFADADLDAAVPGAAMAVFFNSGQVCSAGTRLFVEESIHEEFVGRVAEFSRELKLGSPADPDTMLGPIVSEKQLETVLGYMESGKAAGARILAGGGRSARPELAAGYYAEPTVFAGVTDDMTIAREEIFGPVISAMPFRDLEDVVARANASEYGLGSGVWTKDLSKAHKMARALRAGSVWINCYNATDPAVPFGGYRSSGYGRESGIEHLHEFLETKSVWIRTD